MEPVLKIANYVSNRYLREFGEPIEEMKLHKLLYFTQRESLICLDEPMFPELFEAWKYGPVMVTVREFIHDFGILPPLGDYILPEKYLPVMDYVFENYAHKEAWSLSRLTKGEFSWQNARKDLDSYVECHNPLRLEDIRRDADKMIIRRYLLKCQKEAAQKGDQTMHS